MLSRAIKRSAEEDSSITIKKMRFDTLIQNKGTKRRNEDDLTESSKRSRVTPNGIKRSSDTLLDNPSKRMKMSHTFLPQIIRMMTGCKQYDREMYDDDEGGNCPFVIPIVA